MEHLFGQEWEIVPAGGATGEAFFAQHEEQRLFLKRNSSPFLAVLSAEGIVPKLIWTKRLESGDVITAQQWLEGRELKPPEMLGERVAKLLQKIHGSDPLLGMLRRMGKTPLQPSYLLESIEKALDQELLWHPVVHASLQFLKKELLNIPSNLQVVCHGDVNHNNWLLTKDNQLYLIDWDGAMIGDPALDLSMLLYWYIPEKQWQDWVRLYGITLNDHLRLRLKWYFIAQTLSTVQWSKNKERTEEVEKWLTVIHDIIAN
ncbi:phosphotransferase family protein [Robertmurraya sp. DFI.2.37]|uniref:phosphotransferase family protein n=1 Tax=Robertmurraya sp. DFI.2.37 TaxID=3031819 RepID=UPI001247D698|nr:phosphotransferase family protein [Robertmurraya sp. DFI.2.37]MDF1508678.1 phosphotransferase family protein [Robertmurraya sp. DFI.2.37]